MTDTLRRRSKVQAVDSLSPRGIRSRNRIKAAALKLVNEKGFSNVRIQDITTKAGVANGLFYRYFSGIYEITYELCEDVFSEINNNSKALPFSLHPFDWIYENHLIPVSHFSRNAGILACMFQVPANTAKFGDIWKRSAHEWNIQVAEFISHALDLPIQQSQQMAFLLGAMTEGIIYQTLVRQTEDLLDIAPRPEDVSEVIAVMWYRAIFLDEPPPEKMRKVNLLFTHSVQPSRE